MSAINNLKPKYGSVHKRKRLGTGQGSGHGQTSTRGMKGQHATSGGTKRKGFEGGQTPLLRRVPKSGFSNVQFRQEYEWVNISSLEKYFKAGSEVTPADLLKRRLVKHDVLIKILGDGELKKALNVSAHSFSKGAAEKITKAGGKTTLLVGAKAAKFAEIKAQDEARKKAKTDKK
ncbi:MAG TPA: 50S ribosomal protein L15 [Elusimicrobia bacterium]|nr:MAG: 50S ribosomal protein L15 [Elusimicrobia bacterium GWF2_62_30]HBA61802.1 50S ribosomal protein L15 [Elusimicrobiota bacterium]